MDMTFPFVIWLGRNPLRKNGALFRLVNRGPARENRPDDVPFTVEQRIEPSMMKKTQWGQPRDKQEAIYAMSDILGKILMVDPERLVSGHPINCELNMAVIEEREPKGCDCNGPVDPMDKEPA